MSERSLLNQFINLEEEISLVEFRIVITDEQNRKSELIEELSNLRKTLQSIADELKGVDDKSYSQNLRNSYLIYMHSYRSLAQSKSPDVPVLIDNMTTRKYRIFEIISDCYWYVIKINENRECSPEDFPSYNGQSENGYTTWGDLLEFFNSEIALLSSLDNLDSLKILEFLKSYPQRVIERFEY